MRETGWSLSAAGADLKKVQKHLREVDPSRPVWALLLHAEMHDEKVANNGGVFINVFGPRNITSFGLWYYDSLEDHEYDKIISWEVDLKLHNQLSKHTLPVFLMEMEA